MPTRAEILAQHASRVTAAVAFWIAAVLFVADVSLLSGWLLSQPAAAQPAPPDPAATTEAVPSVVPTPAPTPSLTPFSPLEPVAADPDVVLDGGATVTFPGSPTRTDELVEVGGKEAVLSLHTLTTPDDSTYSLGVIAYPDSVDLGDPAVNLLASVSGAAGNAGGRVVDQNVIKFGDALAVAFDVETPSVRLRARNVLDGRRLYSQTVAYTGDEEPAEADAFFKSFSLTGS